MPATTATVRPAGTDDARAIAEVHIDAWRWAYRGLLPDDLLEGLDIDDHQASWRRRLSTSEAGAAVATGRDGRIVGFSSWGPAADDSVPPPPAAGEIFTLYLRREALGTGVGTTLFRAATSGLASMGFASGVLWVLERNELGRRFYERRGWVWDGTRSTHQVQCSNLPVLRYAGPT